MSVKQPPSVIVFGPLPVGTVLLEDDDALVEALAAILLTTCVRPAPLAQQPDPAPAKEQP